MIDKDELRVFGRQHFKLGIAIVVSCAEQTALDLNVMSAAL